MKNLCYILLFQATCGYLLAQEEDTLHLPEVSVSSPLWQKAGVGQNRVVIEADELEAHSDASLAQEIAIGTPVNITGTGYGLLANPVIRGTHANGTQVFWNGMPVNSPTLGTSDLNLFRSAAFNSISVIPGGSGTELGGGTMGGAILLSRNLNYQPQHQLEAGGGFASFGEASARLGYLYSTKKQAISAGVTHFQTDNNFAFTDIYGEELLLDNAAIRSNGAYLSMGTQLRSNRQLETHFLWQNHRREIPDSRTILRSSNQSKAVELDNQVRWQSVFISRKLRIEQGFNFEAQQYRDLRYFIKDTNNFFQSSSELEYQVLKRENISWFTGGYLNYHRADGSNINQSQAEYGWRSSVLIRLKDQWLLKPALAQSFLDHKSMAFLPSLAVEYYPEPQLHLKAKTGKVFSIPTLNQRYWPGSGVLDILPESGWNTEVSAQWKKGATNLVLALYYNVLHNKVVWLPAPLGSRPANFRKVETPGLELIGKHNIKPNESFRHSLKYSLNLTRPLVVENYTENDHIEDKLLIYVPSITADAAYQITWQNWQSGISAEYNNGAYTTSDNAERYRLDPFLLLHWKMEWLYESENWQFQPGLQILNLLDAEYELYFYRPMPGRVFRFYISLKHNL